MQGLSKSLSLSRAQEAQLNRVKNQRDKHLSRYEIYIQFMSGLLLFLGFIFVASGIAFIRHDLWGEDKHLLKQVKDTSISLIISYCLLILLFGFGGLCIARRRQTNNAWVACYGILIFFVLSIPLMMEGSAILELDHLDMAMVQSMCDMNLTEIEDNHNPLTVELVKAAKRFDLMSELVLDGYMCTKNTCPCYLYDTPNGNTEELFKKETKALMDHDRTFDPDRDNFDSYMYFTTNEAKSFKNANACFETWRDIFKQYGEKQKTKPGTKTIIDGKKGNYFDRRKWERRTLSLVIAEYLEVNEVYLKLEDAYNCSGMCKPALFYFGKDLDQGPPQETCLKHFKQLLSNESRAFAICSVLAGVVGLFLFLTHCGLYSRPQDYDDDINSNAQPRILEPGSVDVNEIQLREQ